MKYNLIKKWIERKWYSKKQKWNIDRLREYTKILLLACLFPVLIINVLYFSVNYNLVYILFLVLNNQYNKQVPVFTSMRDNEKFVMYLYARWFNNKWITFQIPYPCSILFFFRCSSYCSKIGRIFHTRFAHSSDDFSNDLK